MKPAPVSGASTITTRPRVAPIVNAAQSLTPLGLTATPTIAHIRKKVPMNSTTIPGKTASLMRALSATAP